MTNRQCTVTQAAETLGVSRQRVLKLLADGLLTGEKLSPTIWIVSSASVEARLTDSPKAGWHFQQRNRGAASVQAS